MERERMNVHDKEDLKLVIYRLDELQSAMSAAHQKTNRDLRFIKENLFDPDKGLWAETKKNSNFRSVTTKALWFFFPASIATFFKLVWDSLKGS